ncbi:MAG TPA: hypothetical protein DDW54_00570 [Clostridiales bacterium]|nr:hypothetical protein [Clostridiales bacterium]
MKNFNAKMEELILSKYLLADNKISEVLKTVADSSLLYELFEYVTEDFDYNMYKRVCFTSYADKVDFKLPKKNEDLLAFCFLLLMEIDSKKEDLMRLLDEYFRSAGGKQQSYNNFALKVLIPFQLTVKKVAESIIEAENAETEEEKSAGKENRSGYVFSPARKYVLAVKNEVVKSGTPKDDGDRDELIFCLDELSDALAKKDGKTAALAFIGVKFILRGEKRPIADLDKLAALIAEETDGE